MVRIILFGVVWTFRNPQKIQVYSLPVNKKKLLMQFHPITSRNISPSRNESWNRQFTIGEYLHQNIQQLILALAQQWDNQNWLGLFNCIYMFFFYFR